MKLKAGALLYAVFASVVMLVISILILLLLDFFNQNVSFFKNEIHLKDNLHSAIQLSMALENGSYLLDLYSEKKDSVLIVKKQWGVFNYVLVESFNNKRFLKKAALLGDRINKSKVLELSPYNKVLNLCGKSKINGDVYLPDQGVKRAYIEGRSFVGDQLINGTIGLSDHDWNYTLENFDKTDFQFEEDLSDSLVHPFSQETIYIYEQDRLVLGSNSYKGNIVIESETSIFVSSQCSLEDVILIAPIIVLESGFSGQLQLIGSDSILIEENVALLYPSSIICNSKKPSVKLLDSAIVEGVIFIKSQLNNRHFPNLEIHKNALVRGQVYCHGNVEFEGSVYGQMYVDRFILHTNTTVYENHLLDITLDNSLLSSSYLGIHFDDINAKKGIVKWLD
ncbi:hypothetical protein N9H19_02440 [Flavobacteriales bacterium]|nr:hypothetical protein [Flavobacteriales bacterium]